MKCPTLNFNSSFVYRIPDLFTFFSYVLSEYVIFQAIVSKEDSYVAARAKLSIKDILDYPQNKLHYITPVNSIIPCTLGMNFGQLSLWVRLSCDVERVDAFKKKCGLYSQREYVDSIPLTEKDLLKDKPADKTEESPVDLLAVKEQNSQESCVHEAWKNLINSVNPSIRAESSIMSDETFESIVGPPPGHNALSAIVEEGVEKEESDSQISSRGLKARRSSSTIEGIDNGDVTSTEDNDRNVVRDRLSRESSMKKDNEEGKTDAPLEISSTMEFNTFIASPIEKDTIIIEIVNIILFQTSSVMQDDEVKLIYVEYSFLGHRGADMETISVEKPKEPNQKMTYNFLKKFSIEGEEREVERNTLRAMLNESINPNIKFNVVSEPLPEETDIKECAEVGFANFNIREYALGDSEKSISLPIIGTDQNKQVGVLKIFVLGLDAIRQCLGENEANL